MNAPAAKIDTAPHALERFTAARQVMLQAFNEFAQAHPMAAELLIETDSTASAMRLLVALWHG